MANEVAALGLKVDASGVTSGISALDDLAASGPKVENAMDGVEKSVSKTGKSLKTMGVDAAKGLQDISAAAPKVAASFGNIAKSAEDAQKALSGINASLSGLGQVSATANQAATGLSSFTKSLADSQKSLVEMQAQIREASLAAAQMGNVLASARTSVQASAKTQSDVAKSTTDMGAAYKSAGDQVKAYSKAPEEASVANQRAAKSMDTTAVAAKTLASAMAVVGVSFGAQELINMVDGYGKVTSQLRLATNGASDYATAMESVRQISRGAQQGISEVGTLYARIANGTAELGLSQKRLSEITEVVALSLKASGATASESSSAMLQLSQAFASGVLRGEEFNSVNEAAPRLMKALADGIGQPVGALRKMAEEGKLTADVLATALPKALEEVRVEASKMQTIGGSFTVLKNSMMEFFGTTAQASGAVSTITKSVELLADNLNLVTAAALGFGAAKLAQFMITAGAAATKNATDTIAYVAALNQQRAASIAAAEAEAAVSAARVAGLGALQAKLAAERQAALTEAAAATSTSARTQALMAASVAELNLTRTSTQLTAATAAQTAAQTALSGAITATSTAATVASRALSLIGGPIGLITTALGLGVTAWMAWGNSADAASNQAKNSIVSVHQDIVSRLDEQIRKLKDRAGLLAAGNAAAAKDVGPETEELARLNARIQSLKSQGASLAGADQIVLIELQRQYDNLNASLETRKGLQETINGLGVQDRLNALELKKGGFSKEWIAELKTWDDALKAGLKTPQEYAAHINEMNKARYESTKAGKEEAKQSKANASAAKSEESSYARLMATVKAKIAANEEELFAGGKLTESAKLRIQLQAQLDSGSKKLTAAHKEEIKQQIAKLESQEKEEKAIKRAISLNDASIAQDKEIADAQAEMQKRVDSVRKSIYDYSVAVKDSIEMSNLEVQTLGMNNVERNTLIEQLRIEQDLRKRIKAIEDAPYASQEARDADIATVTAEAQKAKANAQTKAYTDEWSKAFDQSSQALTDALMRGGKNAGEYLKDYFSTLVLRPVIQALVQPVAGAIATGVTSALGLGNAAAGASAVQSANSPLGLSTALLFKDFGGGVANNLNLLGGKAYNAGLEGFGESLMDFSSTLKGYSGVINTAGSVLSYGKALLDIGDGKYGAGIGTAVGQYFGGPIGATIGNFLGGALDKALGSRGANHSGAAASSLGTGNTAAAQRLMGDSRGDWYTDLTDRYSADLDKQLSGTVNALAGVYEKLSGYAGDAARSIELVGGFAVNGKYGDEGAVGYGQLWDRVSGQYLGGFSNRDLGTDNEKAWASFVGQMGGLIVDQLKASDIPGWMRSVFDSLGDEITVDGLNQALQAIATVDAAFKGWADTLTGFANLSAEAQTSLINVSGGIDGLAGNVNAFYGGFYSEAERMGILQRQVLEQLAGLDVSVDTSTAEAAKESFRRTVEGALAAGNAELAAKLLALSGSFATAADYAAQAAQTVSQAMESLLTDRRQLEAELLNAQGDSTGYAAAMRAIATEGFGPAELAAYDYNEALRAQIAEAERAATATQDAAAALASLRQQAAGIVQSQQQGLDSLIAGLQRKAEQASGGYVGSLFLSGAEFTQFSGFADQLTGATTALEQLQTLGLGDELAGYADQIGAIVQGTKEALAGALSSQRLLAGDGMGALAAAISANLVQYADFSQGGQFRAGAFNAANATQRAQAASGLIGDASANALNIPGIAGVLGGLVGEIATYSRDVVLRDLRVQGAEDLGPLVSGLLTGVYERLADAAQAQMISGPGLAGVMSARVQAGGAVLDMQAFGQAVEAVRGALDAGRISAAEADKALAYLNGAFSDLAPLLGDVAGQTARAAAAAVDLRNAGVASVEYYFGSLAGVVGQMDAAAAAANSPLAQTANVIGLLDSTATAFGQSAGAALEGAQAAIAGYLDAAAMAREQGAWADSWAYSNRAADAQLALGSLTGADSRVSRAQLIADAAAMASGIMTTASAAKAAEELAGKLVLGEGQSMRDLSLLVSGVGQYDNAGFYDAFARIGDALGSGSISNEQYKTLFDYALGTYQGVSDEANATASAFERLRDSMRSFADALLIGDKTTLSPEATLAEMQRQYTEAFKLAATGDSEAISKYQSLASGLLDKSLYSTQAEYNVAFSRTYGDARTLEAQGLSMLAAKDGGVVSELRTLNSSLSKRVEDLEKNLTAALAQIAKNTSDTVKGVRQQTQAIEEGGT